MICEKKNIVSMRLNNSDRYAIQIAASRLFIRESELYRFAVSNLLDRMHKLNDWGCKGSDLLPLFIEFREQFSQNLAFKKQQLFKILNNGNAHPDKYVAMADIELLILPQHLLRQRLLQTKEALAFKQQDASAWLKSYFAGKYRLGNTVEEGIEANEAKAQMAQSPGNLNPVTRM
jgi:hypothetical protein